MITNLFSVFDPSSSIISLNWLILIVIVLFIPTIIWKIISPTKKIKDKIILTFKKEVGFSLGKKEKGRETIIIITFFIILTINFLALYPQIFSVTSHLTVTLPMSLCLWLTLMIFGWLNNTNHILRHLVPQGTPGMLMSFIVIIEMVRNLIRPITLCVRLTANLVAGHLLISLLGNALLNTQVILGIALLPIPITLSILESAVAGIQAYVFITLITLYTTETK